MGGSLFPKTCFAGMRWGVGGERHQRVFPGLRLVAFILTESRGDNVPLVHLATFAEQPVNGITRKEQRRLGLPRGTLDLSSPRGAVRESTLAI